MKEYTVIRPCEIVAGQLLMPGAKVELDTETAKRYATCVTPIAAQQVKVEGE